MPNEQLSRSGISPTLQKTVISTEHRSALSQQSVIEQAQVPSFDSQPVTFLLSLPLLSLPANPSGIKDL